MGDGSLKLGQKKVLPQSPAQEKRLRGFHYLNERGQPVAQPEKSTPRELLTLAELRLENTVANLGNISRQARKLIHSEIGLVQELRNEKGDVMGHIMLTHRALDKARLRIPTDIGEHEV